MAKHSLAFRPGSGYEFVVGNQREFCTNRMKTFSSIRLMDFTCVFVLAGALTLTSGCIYVQNSSNNGGSMADAKAMTNRTMSGDLPANLKSLEIDNRFGFVHVVATDSASVNWSWK